jgi:RNA polymerase sigma factor (sigma-70 family)
MTAPPKTADPLAPPEGPVEVAVNDPDVLHRLQIYARQIIRTPGACHEDIVHEACMRALRNPGKFDSQMGKIVNWLCGFILKIGLEQRRKFAQTPRLERNLEHLAAPEVRDQLELDELNVLLGTLLHRLDEKYRVPVELCRLRGWEYSAVAEHLQLTEVTVRQRVSRGINQLRMFAAKGGQS